MTFFIHCIIEKIMAVLENGIHGIFRGKIGKIIGLKVNGKQYARSLPGPSKNLPTVGQLNQRLKFKLLMEWLRPLKAVIDVGYLRGSGHASPLNRAMSYHLKEAVIGVAPDYVIDFSKVILSRGRLLPSVAMEMSLVGNCLLVTWADFHWSMYCDLYDRACFVVYNVDRKEVLMFPDVAERREGKVSLCLTEEVAVGRLHVWMQYVGREGLVSTTVYLGLL